MDDPDNIGEIVNQSGSENSGSDVDGSDISEDNDHSDSENSGSDADHSGEDGEQRGSGSDMSAEDDDHSDDEVFSSIQTLLRSGGTEWKQLYLVLLMSPNVDEPRFVQLMEFGINFLSSIQDMDQKGECLDVLLAISQGTKCKFITEPQIRSLAPHFMNSLNSNHPKSKRNAMVYICQILEEKKESKALVKNVFFKALEMSWGRDNLGEFAENVKSFEEIPYFLSCGPIVSCAVLMFNYGDQSDIDMVENFRRCLAEVNIDMAKVELNRALDKVGGLRLIQSFLMAVFPDVKIKSLALELFKMVYEVAEWHSLKNFLDICLCDRDKRDLGLEYIGALAVGFKNGEIKREDIFHKVLVTVFVMARRERNPLAKSTLKLIIECNIDFGERFTDEYLDNIKSFCR